MSNKHNSISEKIVNKIEHNNLNVGTISGNDIAGVAKDVGSGSQPLNGLRHLATSTTSGWYVWTGNEMSSDADFYEPLHIEHLLEQFPFLKSLLELEPGSRFLIDINTGYVDLWYDKALLIE